MSDDEFDLEGFELALEQSLENGRAAFEGKYKDELHDLVGLSREEIDAITPGGADLQAYDQLITVVKEASRVNLGEAELKNQIEKLGGVAIQIARKSARLAALLLERRVRTMASPARRPDNEGDA